MADAVGHGVAGNMSHAGGVQPQALARPPRCMSWVGLLPGLGLLVRRIGYAEAPELPMGSNVLDPMDPYAAAKAAFMLAYVAT
jgi:hypothetical protein